MSKQPFPLLRMCVAMAGRASLFALPAVVLLTAGGSAAEDVKQPVSMRTIDSTWPAPPGEESWGFVEDLKKPLPFVLFWKDGGSPQPGQIDLRVGLTVNHGFPDEKGVLHYEFGLPRLWLPTATFAFRNYHPSMPSMDAYILRLERFAAPGGATPSGLQTAYDVEPVIVSMEEPVYPDSAREKGVQGVVLVRVLVGEDGRVKDSLVIQSVPLLDEAAVAAARTAVFEPAMKDDRPVAVWMVIPIEYRLHR